MRHTIVYCVATKLNGCGAEASAEHPIVFPDGFGRLDALPAHWQIYHRSELAFAVCGKEACRKAIEKNRNKLSTKELRTHGDAFLFVPTGPLTRVDTATVTNKRETIDVIFVDQPAQPGWKPRFP